MGNIHLYLKSYGANASTGKGDVGKEVVTCEADVTVEVVAKADHSNV